MKNIINVFLIVVNIIVLIALSYTKEEMITVEVKGMVKDPGVYTIKLGSTTNDAINISGGLIEGSDISVTNLARKLKDEDVIIIYSDKEVEEMYKTHTSVKYIDKECICPIVKNSSIITSYISNIDTINFIKSTKVSINSATLDELKAIKGLGESKAKAIIEYRDKNNGFKSIEEIMNVKGIGKSIFEKIKDYITL